MKESFKKNWHIWTLAAIVVLGFFVRAWQLEDTVLFQMDQSRDAILIKNAFDEGPGMLPLLGPRAASTFLRLGPIFYYFQYTSAVISQNIEPVSAVYPEILFSLLTIPLFFIFLNQFFKKSTSVALAGLFGFSFLMVQFSRFAWNPNQTPFWSLLFLLAIFKASTHENKKKAGWWLICAAAAYGILSQLHFTALLTFPIIAGLFWLFYRPKKIKLVFWGGAVATLLFFYVPMLISEVITGWDNVDQFSYALTHKSKEYPLKEKIEQSLELHGKYYALSLTSYGNTKDKFFVYAFYLMVAFFFWRSFQIWKGEKAHSKKVAFLVLVGIWFFVFFLLYTQLSFTVLKPRFWLLIAAIPYVFLGLFLEWLYRTGHKKRGRVVAGIIIGALLLGNAYAIFYWYWSLANQKEPEIFYVRNLELKQANLVGIKQMKEAMAYMVSRSEETGKTICYNTDGQYKRVYKYLLPRYHPGVIPERMSFSEHTNEECILFAVENGGPEDQLKIPKEYRKFFQGIRKEKFGAITVWEVWKDEEGINEYIQNKKEQKAQEKVEQESVAIASEEEEEEEDEKPDRKERVFWKNVFSGDYEE